MQCTLNPRTSCALSEKIGFKIDFPAYIIASVMTEFLENVTHYSFQPFLIVNIFCSVSQQKMCGSDSNCQHPKALFLCATHFLFYYELYENVINYWIYAQFMGLTSWIEFFFPTKIVNERKLSISRLKSIRCKTINWYSFSTHSLCDRISFGFALIIQYS